MNPVKLVEYLISLNLNHLLSDIDVGLIDQTTGRLTPLSRETIPAFPLHGDRKFPLVARLRPRSGTLYRQRVSLSWSVDTTVRLKEIYERVATSNPHPYF